MIYQQMQQGAFLPSHSATQTTQGMATFQPLAPESRSTVKVTVTKVGLGIVLQLSFVTTMLVSLS